MTVWAYLGIYLMLSVVVSLVVGRVISFGMGSDQENG